MPPLHGLDSKGAAHFARLQDFLSVIERDPKRLEEAVKLRRKSLESRDRVWAQLSTSDDANYKRSRQA